MIDRDSDYYLDLQTKTGWGRTLFHFAEWCAPRPGWFSLDVGCGPGLLPAIFADLGCHATGVDVDADMFTPVPLHASVVVGDAYHLPFKPHSFDVITAVNLLFLLDDPIGALRSMKKTLKPGGKLAMLNPSELLDEESASAFASEKGLVGLANDTFINWARRATHHHRWIESETIHLYEEAELRCADTILKVGPGFARFSWGTT